MHIREKIKSWGQRNCLQSSETGLYRGTDLGKATKNKSASLKVLKTTVPSIILKWKKFGTTRNLPKAGRPVKLSNWCRRALSRLVTKKLMVALFKLHGHICRWEKPTEGQKSLKHSTDLGLMTVWPNSILSSEKKHENTYNLTATQHLKDPQTLRNKIIWSDEPQF